MSERDPSLGADSPDVARAVLDAAGAELEAEQQASLGWGPARWVVILIFSLIGWAGLLVGVSVGWGLYLLTLVVLHWMGV